MGPAALAAAGANGPGAALSAALNGDASFLVRIGPPNLTADLEAALEGLDPVRCAVVRIGNPLNAPLTPQRVMLQLAPDGEDEPKGVESDEAGRLLRTVAVRAAGRPSLLVVVEQAETLTPAALALLQLLPELRGPGVPSVRVAFHGTPAFHALLGDPQFRPIRDHDAPSPPPLPSRRLPEWHGRGVVLGVASVAVTLLLAATLLLLRGISPIATVPAATASSSPAPVTTASPDPATLPAPSFSAAGNPAVPSPDIAPQPHSSADAAPSITPQPPSTVVESPAASRARLFREFNAFVEARGLAGRLSRSERETLFEEYLVRRSVVIGPIVPSLGAPGSSTPAAAAATAPTPASLPASVPEVVLFFRTGRPDAEARAGENAVMLRRQVNDVTIRPAPDGPADPAVRYFRPEDRSLALALALALPSTTPDWQIVDLSDAADRPIQPTIEIWLPGTP